MAKKSNPSKRSQADTYLHVTLEAAEALRLYGEEVDSERHVSYEQAIDHFLQVYCPDLVALEAKNSGG